jgi:ELWxxDGT repeat protein
MMPHPETDRFQIHRLSMPRHSLPLTFALLVSSSLTAQGDFKSIGDRVNVAGNLFFVAGKAPGGQELWVLEAGKKSAHLVKDIHAGPNSSGVAGIVAFGKRAVFAANDGKSGEQLWISNGTTGGTTMLTSIKADAADAGIAHGSAVVAGSVLYFFVKGAKGARALWKTDGTSDGTKLVKPFEAVANPDPNFDHRPTAMPTGVVVFRVGTSKASRLWCTDGTTAGTRCLCDVGLAPTGPFTLVGPKLAFTAGSGATWDIWLTDGTKAGTKKLHGKAAAKAGGGKIDGPRTTKGNRKLAKIHFLTYCVTCHGQSGKGDGPAAIALKPKPRDWTDSKWQASVTDKRILQVVRDGGAAVGLSPLMAPNPMYGKNPAVLKALVEMIRKFDGKK